MRGLLWSTIDHRPNASKRRRALRTDVLMPDDPLRTLLQVLVYTWDTDQLEAFERAMYDAHETGNIVEHNLFVNCDGESEMIGKIR